MDVFAVIADPTRRHMIDMMAAGELPAGTFVAAFPNVSQPAISQHLKVLRDCGLVSVRADRQRRLYSLVPDALAPLSTWLAYHQPATTAPEPSAASEADPKPQRNAKSKPKPAPEMTLDLFS